MSIRNLIQAHISANYPPISGIILTGGLIPEESILKLIEGLSQIVPIVSVQGGTFGVTNQIGSIKSQIYKDSKQKIMTSLAVSEKYLNLDSLTEKLFNFQLFSAPGLQGRSGTLQGRSGDFPGRSRAGTGPGTALGTEQG